MNWLQFSQHYGVLTAAECVSLFLVPLKSSEPACQWQGAALMLLSRTVVAWEVTYSDLPTLYYGRADA